MCCCKEGDRRQESVLYLKVTRVHVNTKIACSDVSSPAGELMFGSELPSDGESQYLIATEEVCRSE